MCRIACVGGIETIDFEVSSLWPEITHATSFAGTTGATTESWHGIHKHFLNDSNIEARGQLRSAL